MEKLNDQVMENVVGGAITEEEALAAALEKAGLKKNQIDFMKRIELDWERGRKVYEIEFYFDGFEYEFDIDAESGKVLKYKKDWD